MQTLIIDYYDSFTYNLYQLIAEIQGTEPIVLYHDAKELAALNPNYYDQIILSPGPGHPDNPSDFGIGKWIIQNSPKPLLGICLGHQGIFSVFGGKVECAPIPVHGLLSTISHLNDPLYACIPNQLQVMRYHSLLCTGIVPAELEITAWTQDKLIMGLRHRSRPIWGIQYHPESIAGEYGKQLLINFTQLTREFYQKQGRKLPSSQTTMTAREPHTACQLAPLSEVCTTFEVMTQQCAFQGDTAAIFQKAFVQHDVAVWLDSSQIIPGFSRFSYMGAPDGPHSYHVNYDAKTQITNVCRHQEKTSHAISIFTYLKQTLQSIRITPRNDLPFDFHGGFIGYLGYELNQETAPISHGKRSPYPDAQWVFLDRFVVFDHLEQTCYLVGLSLPGESESCSAWFKSMLLLLQQERAIPPIGSPQGIVGWALVQQKYNADLVGPRSNLQPLIEEGKWVQTPDTYTARIQDCLDLIAAGESYEICLTNTLQFSQQVDPLSFYYNLRHCHPAPHAAYFKFSELGIACSSMERFLKIDRHRKIQAKPIKGTTPRGKTQQEDDCFAQSLQEDEKFYSEHVMIVDLLRNDLGKICQIDSISVPEFMKIESYATVHQLVSLITGHLKPDKDVIDCILHTFPGGSMTGAPKIRTMDIIHQLETQARGIYSGSMGYISLNGASDLNIVIRTAVLTPQGISIGAGGAIVILSDPAEEFAEIELKTKALRTALSMSVKKTIDD